MQFSYEPQATTSADSTGNGFAPISAVTAALVRGDEAPSSTAAGTSAITTDNDEDTDSQSQASADTLVDELVSAAAAAAAATATAASASESTIQLEDIASEAARQHGIN